MKKPPPSRYDDDKLEEAVVALLGALPFENGRVWKRYNFAIVEAPNVGRRKMIQACSIYAM